jgi:hypothetical protein
MPRPRIKPHDHKVIKMSGPGVWQLVTAYPSHGKRYYRYMAGSGDAVEICKHIPGGPCGSAVAEARASEVGRWIRLGRRTEDVLGLINSWGRGRK